MSGGLLALLENPDQFAKLRANPDGLMKLAVEEMIRWSTPVSQFCRTATQDYTLRGKTIRSGDNLGLFYASANRDEEIFEEPTKFKVDRQPNRHIAFGMGPICAWQHSRAYGIARSIRSSCRVSNRSNSPGNRSSCAQASCTASNTCHPLQVEAGRLIRHATGACSTR
jgi:hypothetical protein